MTNLGRWDRWYTGLPADEPQAYGGDGLGTVTYELGATFLADCDTVEDWGCGKGWMTKFVPPERYRGIDGSDTPFADVTADLVTYRSSVDGVFMRHVLEHNTEWSTILQNAATSAQKRLVVVLFTPLQPVTRVIRRDAGIGVPDIGFHVSDLTDVIVAAGLTVVETKTIKTKTQYKTETIIFAERQS